MNKFEIKNHLSKIIFNWEQSLINLMNNKYDLSNIDNDIDIFLDENDNNDNNLLAIFSQKIFQKHIEQYKVTLHNSIIISGGSITSLLLNEEVNDYDFYFTDKKIIESLIIFYLTLFNKHNKTNWKWSNKFNCIYKSIEKIDESILTFKEFQKNVEIVEAIYSHKIKEIKNQYFPICITKNAISLTNKIQLIIRFSGTPEEILSNFDYVHTKNYYDYGKNSLILNPKALESILTKQLYYVGSKFPICSLIRSKKFLSKGWNISPIEYLKIAFQIKKLNLYDINILKEQLIGVYSKYFINLLEKLKENNSLKNIDIFSYLEKVINEIDE